MANDSSSKTPGDVTVIPYSDFAADLEELPTAIVNRIERERWGALRDIHPGLPTLLTHMIRVGGATWEAIVVLVLRKQFKELLPSRLATAVAPLERRLLDALMAVVFLLNDPKDRTDWYYRSGWREAAELQLRFVEYFRDKPEWASFLSEHEKWVDSHSADLGITEEERAKPELATQRWAGKLRHWWPNPGRMKDIASGDSGEYLTLLHVWLYGQLSADSHLSYMGLVRQGGVLQAQHDGPTRDQFRTTVSLSAMAVHLALLSEVIVAASLPIEAKRAVRIWGEMKETFTGDMLWTKRYASLLGAVQ